MKILILLVNIVLCNALQELRDVLLHFFGRFNTVPVTNSSKYLDLFTALI